MEPKTDQPTGEVAAVTAEPTGDEEAKRQGQMDELAGKTKRMLGEAADWAGDRLKDVSDRFSKHPGSEAEGELPDVAHRPPAPVSGDEGARAAGKVKDDIT